MPRKKQEVAAETVNEMRQVVLDKVVVNIGAGAAGERLNKAARVVEMLTKHKPVFTTAKKTVRDFNIRKGLPKYAFPC